MLLSRLTLFISLFLYTYAFYDKSSSVVELTEANFKNRVLNDDSIWIIEFYAPWCGHCKNLVPEYKKTANALKGLAKVGAVDMTQYQSVGAPYNVQGFPTIKIFGANKKNPTDYNGARTAQALVDAVVSEFRATVNARLGSKSSSSGKSSATGDVITLTDTNFESLVLKSRELWLVEFYAPWCGHCKNLEPHWRSAASKLKGKVKLGALDATIHTVMANRFNIRGFPTIKFFEAGNKSIESAIDYDGGRTSSDIVQWASSKVDEQAEPPELKQAVSQAAVNKACGNRQLCIITFLPHILDCQTKCRNEYLNMLKQLTEKFRRNPWGWIWAEAGQQPELEKSFGVGGFGYPAMIAANTRKLKYSTMTGSFGADGISEFLRDLSYGRGKTSSMYDAEFPNIVSVEAWNGKDGELPAIDDIDLSDVDLDEDIKTEL